MSNSDENGQASDQIKTELSKDDLLKYIELDLWSKFKERLWKLVGIALTLVTIIGFLGIPYYIRNEVNSHLQQREKEFTDKTDEILAYSKLLAVLRARYDSERYQFDTDVLRIVSALTEAKKGDAGSDNKPRFGEPGEELISLISRSDFAQVTEGSFMAKNAFNVPQDMKDKKLLPETTITVENKGPSGASAYQQIHPVRNGTYEGSIKDLRYRIVVLEALRRSIDSLQEKMLALGGNSALEKRVEVVRVKALESTEFHDTFSTELTTIANAFLTSPEQDEFAKLQELYVLGYKTNYTVPKKDSQPSPTNTPTESKRQAGNVK
jgi:hypothetical protein